jgi:hypothetical protein
MACSREIRKVAAGAVAAALLAAPAPGAQEPDNFLRGDVSLDGSVNITDAIIILNCQFFAIGCFFACEDAGDVDDNGAINITDAVLLLSALFLEERIVPPPGVEECGADPTPDFMMDCAYDACPAGP